jgi:hypothetical protein
MSKEKMTMSRIKIATALAFGLVLVGLVGSPGASAGGFGTVPGSYDFRIQSHDGTVDTRAGVHPFSVTTEFQLNNEPDPRNPASGGDGSDRRPGAEHRRRAAARAGRQSGLGAGLFVDGILQAQSLPPLPG